MNLVSQIYLDNWESISSKIYAYKSVKSKPSDWTEKHVYLTSDISRYQGKFRYDVSPYTREVIDCLDPSSPVEQIAIIKCAQSGFTQGVIIPGICYIIAENPGPVLFMAGDAELSKNSVETRLDPVIQNAGLSHLIRPNVIRKRNQRTGDTSKSKEFAGGQLIIMGTKNADKFRQFSVKYVFADDWEAAPRNDKDEGSTRKLIEGRTTSYGNVAKKFYISTPAVKQTSNIEPVYDMGDQRKWNWTCPNCKKYIPVEWRIQNEDGSYSGIMYKLDDRGELIEDSVHYKCQQCGGKILERQKAKLNIDGIWIPTAKPVRPNYRSYYLNALVIPPGFTSWTDLVYEWLEANPANGQVDVGKLKTFVNIRLGQTFEEKGETPRIMELMKNTRSYPIGVVPNEICEDDGNGDIIMLTLAADLNGIMERNNDDVRLDWEIVAHSSTGVTYSVDHGSIGTFKRSRDKSKKEKELDGDRYKMTYHHNHENSVWPLFKNIMDREIPNQDGEIMNIAFTVIDTGNFTNKANEFIDSVEDRMIVGAKGVVEENYRKIKADKPKVRPSREKKNLYLIEVNQFKDDLAANIKLVPGSDGYQPPGFMNFPQPSDGKYLMNSFFIHFEGEKRIEDVKDGVPVGFKWVKKNSQSLNHFWDVRIYNLAARDIYLDMYARSEKMPRLTWAEFVEIVS